MIGMTELKKGMLAVLKGLYQSSYHYYGIEVVEGYEKPSFFTQLIPVSVENESNGIKDKVMMFVITYFQKEPDEADALVKVSEIERAYGNKVKIGDRYINVTDLDFDFVGVDGNILQIKITVSFKDDTGKKEKEYETMRNMRMKWR